MNKSKRHHFIPVFYLKNFTKDDGRFYIYDVKKEIFKNNGAGFAPKSQFFEWEGNTVFYGPEASDFIENSFTNWDNNVANIYNKITSYENDYAYYLKGEEWTMLQYFVNILYWRNPSNTDKVKEYIKKASSTKELGLKLLDKVTGEKAAAERQADFLEKLKADPNFPTVLKYLLPVITYPEIFEKQKNDFAHIISFPHGLPKLVSDNPIIYRKLVGETLHTDEFIFPLTPTKILFRNHMKGMLVPSQIRVLIESRGRFQ